MTFLSDWGWQNTIPRANLFSKYKVNTHYMKQWWYFAIKLDVVFNRFMGLQSLM